MPCASTAVPFRALGELGREPRLGLVRNENRPHALAPVAAGLGEGQAVGVARGHEDEVVVTEGRAVTRGGRSGIWVRVRLVVCFWLKVKWLWLFVTSGSL